jgi:Carbohydrate esterase, sialic acid-specific acetylesterase
MKPITFNMPSARVRSTLWLTLPLIGLMASVALPQPANAAPPKPPRVMVALVFGQSNAGNWGESRRTAGPRVFTFFRGRYARAKDPLPGANGEGGSPWTRLGDKLIAAKRYDQVIFVPASIGATEIALWAPGGLLHQDLLRNVRETQEAGYTFTHLLWVQGESDNALNTSQNDYYTRFLEMLAAIRGLGVNAPAYVALATRCGQYPPSPTIRQAQTDVRDASKNIFAGPDLDTLDVRWRHDGCHFSDKGLERHAEMWMQVIQSYK